MSRTGQVALLVGLGLLAAAAAGVAVGEWSGWRFLRGPIASALGGATGTPARLDGHFRLRLLRQPGLEVEHLEIGAGAGVPVPHLLRAEHFAVQWRWRDLWQARNGGPLQLLSLGAESLDAHIVRLADGRASWQLGRPAQAVPGDPPNTPADGGKDSSAGEARLPHIARLSVADGLIRLVDEPLQTQAEIRARLDTADRSALVLTATGRHRATPLQLQGRVGDAFGGLAADTPLQLQGRYGSTQLRYDGRAGDLLGSRRLDGHIRLAGPSLAASGEPFALTLPHTAAFVLDGRLQHDGGLWRLGLESFRVGGTRLKGRFAVDTRQAIPRLDGQVDGGVLRLADLGPAVGTTPGAAGAADTTKPPAAGRRVLPDRPFDLPSLTAMQADVRLNLDQLDFGSEALGDGRALRAHVRLNDGVLRIDDLRLDVAGGRFEGHSQLDPRNGNARWTLDLGWQGLQLERWVLALQRADQRPPWLSGRLQGRAQVVGAGRSTADILGSLDGRIATTLRDGRISHLAVEALGLDLAQLIGVAVRGDQALPLRCARVTLAVKSGVAQVVDGVADNRDSTLRLAGTIKLSDETLDLVARARPKDFTPLALRTPLRVQGPWSQPRVSPDGGPLAGRLLAALALSTIAPPAALLALVDPGSGAASSPDNPSADDPCRTP